MTTSAVSKTTLSEGFDEVADTYDLMVSLNPGYRRHLREAAEALLDEVTGPEPLLLDVGCGSGLSTRELAEAAAGRGLRATVVGIDASAGMLAQARRHDWPAGVSFRHARAEEIGGLGLGPADGVLACYLVRNVPDLPVALTALRDALAPGGCLVVEDYSVAESPAAARRWRTVNRLVILPLAGVIAHRRELYEYLHRSVTDFMGIRELGRQLREAGFSDVESRTVTGWQNQILHLVRARRG